MGLAVLVVVGVRAVGVDEGGVRLVERGPVGAPPEPCEGDGEHVYYHEEYEEHGKHGFVCVEGAGAPVCRRPRLEVASGAERKEAVRIRGPAPGRACRRSRTRSAWR